jgi:hypothetical protein
MNEQDGKRAEGAKARDMNDRREFLRKSFGVAPLMLTLGSRSYGGGTSIHGTLWSSLGTKWKHKGDWWRFKKDGWRWTKNSGDTWRGKDEHKSYTSKDHDDWRRDEKIKTEHKDWNWDKSDESWQREIEAQSTRKDSNPDRRAEKDSGNQYDWRKDDDWKRSRGLDSHNSDQKNRNKD